MKPMTDLVLTKHAQARLQQRGLKLQDIELIGQYGEYVDKGILMTTDAVDEALASLKRRMKRLEKLRGRLLITDGDTVVTIYRATDKQTKLLLGSDGNGFS